MIGTLYRYPHPNDPNKFIYVGQGPNRDKDHRTAQSSFGRRFKRKFPNTELSKPIKEQIEISNYLELNEEEIIWMFRYHTWSGYPDGMNLTFPGPLDYKRMGKLGGQAAVDSGQIRELAKSGIGGRIGVRNQSREAKVAAALRSIELYGPPGTPEGSRKGGFRVHELHPEQAVQNGYKAGNKIKKLYPKQFAEMSRKAHELHPDLNIRAGLVGGNKNVETGWIQRLAKRTNCLRWNIRRGKLCICGEHKNE